MRVTEPTKELNSRADASNPCLSATETKEYPSFFYFMEFRVRTELTKGGELLRIKLNLFSIFFYLIIYVHEIGIA